MDLETSFRELVFKYGLEPVITCMFNYIEKEYNEVSRVYNRIFNKVKEEPISVSQNVSSPETKKEEQPVNVAQNNSVPDTKKEEQPVSVAQNVPSTDTKQKKPVKKANKNLDTAIIENEIISIEHETTEEGTIGNVSDTLSVISEQESESVEDTIHATVPETPKRKKKETTPKSTSSDKKIDENKQRQRQLEKKKKAENEAKGITEDMLLTKENLTDLILNKKHTYAYIAAHIIGCSENKVSQAAKIFKIPKPKKNKSQEMIVAKKLGRI